MANFRTDAFEYKKPSEAAIEAIKIVREECKHLSVTLLTHLTDCRERSLALTKLEELSMWANKAAAFELVDVAVPENGITQA